MRPESKNNVRLTMYKGWSAMLVFAYTNIPFTLSLALSGHIDHLTQDYLLKNRSDSRKAKLAFASIRLIDSKTSERTTPC